MPFIDSPSFTLSVRAYFIDSPSLSLVVSSRIKASKIDGLSDGPIRSSRDYGQASIYAGQDFAFIFVPPYSTGGWDFNVSLYPEVSGSDAILTKESFGDYYAGQLLPSETADLDPGDYMLVCRMTKGSYSDTDILRLHVGKVI